MKQPGLLLFLLLYLHSLQAQNTAASFKKLSWLAGSWKRTNTPAGHTAYERWEYSGEHMLKGYGLMLRGQDTAFIEKLLILVKDDALYYVADVKGNPQPVYFRITEISKDGFVCENPEHDFPKQIAYRREGRQLQAVISGNGKAVDYRFEREE